ncbi:putative uncharacterized protein DDB_G0271606 [Scaptodrosophila lebanonensis]|uniref:MANSC domain-containing protein n=1 Tax=Drosophila lebanonensis TaxID=7225 RepID=A0A6J2U7W4_DROLE|nr:putative uncharacterized protein DDB_G0271606 [Scaptodrosophila lebanonensis]XP_030384071.1 putative uncharacterized protein DDB_G0271606 [Scaptodrosophila lebanonensis]
MLLNRFIPALVLVLGRLSASVAGGAGQPEFAVAPEANVDVTHRLAKRMDLESCIGHFDVHKNTIIRTGESQAIGGKYLQGLELDTIEECERLCCETDSCDVYIFERKAGGYCYLFECGPPENFHCKFTRHANYTSAVLTPQVRHAPEPASTPRPQLPHIPSNNISQQEWELTNLKLKPEVRDKSAPPDNAAVLTASVVAASTGAAASTNQLVGLGAPHPDPVAQSAPLAPHCGRFQFSCHSGECIAVYNACDGIPQCEDGSDEGPECNAIASNPTKGSSNGNNNNNNVAASKPINAAQYQSQSVASMQQQLQAAQPQQQQQQLPIIVAHSIAPGPPPPPPPPPPVVNNREDAAAWANRKLITDAQQQQQQQPPQMQAQGEILNADELNSHIFNHKGGLQLQLANAQGQGQGQGQGQEQLAGYVAVANGNNNNNNAQLGSGALYGMSLPHTALYLTPSQQQQQQQQQQLQSVMPQGMAWPQAAQPQPQMLPPEHQQQPLLQQQQQQRTAYTLANGVGTSHQLLPAKPMTANAPELPPQPRPLQPHSQQQVLLPVLNAAPTHDKTQSVDEDEYEDYEEEKSTEPPKKKKQRKHKKAKAKNPPTNTDSKDPIELALEQTKQKAPPTLPLAASPVHEQYKMIHENLALEFRDHDGHSERPGGAVLSLTMGLLITAALAILIGCRMRTVGRRTRRMGGKTPYSQEADFLVNGMYL